MPKYVNFQKCLLHVECKNLNVVKVSSGSTQREQANSNKMGNWNYQKSKVLCFFSTKLKLIETSFVYCDLTCLKTTKSFDF